VKPRASAVVEPALQVRHGRAIVGGADRYRVSIVMIDFDNYRRT